MLLFKIFSPAYASPKLPVTKIKSPILVLFLFTIFFAKPITVTVNDVILEYVVSPPLSNNLYFF